MEIGRIISTENTPNTKEFWAVLNNNDVKIGDFVKVKLSENNFIVGKVVEIINSNKYLTNIYSIKEFLDNKRDLSDFLPLDKWEVLLSKIEILFLFENNLVNRNRYSPKPGLFVEKLENELISKFLGFDENGIHIGYLNDIEVKLNLDKLFRKHCCILAQSGFGKSYTTQVLIEEILNKKDYKMPAIVVIDTHGEYKVFSLDNEFALKTKVFDVEEVKFSTINLNAEMLSEIIPELTGTAKRELRKIIAQLKEKKKVFDLEELLFEIERAKINDNVKNPIISWLEDIKSLNIFEKLENPNIKEITKPNSLVIFDLSSSTSLRKKQIVVAILLRELFTLRRQNLIPPTIVIIEESHQFAPEQEEKSRALSKPIIETIAREGRKFGISLVLISQRPIQLSKTALSQCDTKIIMHISNPYDIDHIAKSAEYLSKEEIEMFSKLSIGEAFVCGEVVKFPILVKIREKRTKGNISKSFDELIQEYYIQNSS